jgi:beta-lactamase superfamily II metal-dependent hydrolase
LLLPGDAEWGVWKHILADEKSVHILRGATFFKVGHHGSHNATSKTLVEHVLPKRIPAMISTQKGPQPYRNNIPHRELLEALDEHEIPFARSDESEELPEGFEAASDKKWIDLDLPC